MCINISKVESVPTCKRHYTSLGKTESPISIAIFSLDCGFVLETKGQRVDFSLAKQMYFECKEQDIRQNVPIQSEYLTKLQGEY